jgi:hypothetical protein
MRDLLNNSPETISASERQARGTRARLLLEDGTLRAAHDQAQTRLLRAWRDAGTVEEREKCHAALGALGLLRRELEAMAADGAFAAATGR